jgi:hypothetical protein
LAVQQMGRVGWSAQRPGSLRVEPSPSGSAPQRVRWGRWTTPAADAGTGQCVRRALRPEVDVEQAALRRLTRPWLGGAA